MPRTQVAVVGGGQAGLAVSYLLTAASVEHVVLERGRIAHRWNTQRWDSMRMLTPNWMTRLPGWSYRGAAPNGFMPAAQVAEFLCGYATTFNAPVLTGADVQSVSRRGRRYVVETLTESWTADAVVVATGFCDQPAVPAAARDLDLRIAQITPDRYRRPSDLPAGGVLVVGASATGVQLADELARHGRPVVLAVGRHTRIPRRYRGVDIMWWLDAMGVLDRPLEPVRPHLRGEPSLQLVGSPDQREVDLPALASRGVRFTGRFLGVESNHSAGVICADDLAETTGAAAAKLGRLLQNIDAYATAAGLHSQVDPPGGPHPFTGALPVTRRRLDLRAAGVRSVLWATGYRRHYPWLHLPVLDSAGDIQHAAGITPAPGLVVVGQQRQTRRSSTFVDGVRHDAATVVEHLLRDVLTKPARRAS